VCQRRILVNFPPDDILQIFDNSEQPFEQPIEQPFQQPFQPQPQPQGQAYIYQAVNQPAAVAPQAAFPAGGFGQNPTCFSSDTEVLTKLGRKTMEQLRIGDEILTADRNRVCFIFVGHDRPTINLRHHSCRLLLSFTDYPTHVSIISAS
jgi:hypothetical protein